MEEKAMPKALLSEEGYGRQRVTPQSVEGWRPPWGKQEVWPLELAKGKTTWEPRSWEVERKEGETLQSVGECRGLGERQEDLSNAPLEGQM